MAKKSKIKIPGVKILGKIGQGQQGVVIKGKWEENGTTVAVKILQPQLAQVAEYRRRFAREMGVATQLDHPNIVKALKAGKLKNSFYYVMEYAQGNDVNVLLEKLGPFPEKKAVKVAAQVASALAYAHQEGLVHRDIKPGNIMVDKNWNVKILDLGLAKDNTAGVALTMAGTIFGTANYISPEAIEDSSAVDARSDIFSLGATLYKMLTGDPPFDGMTPTLIMEQVLHHEPVPVREKKPELSKGVAVVVETALRKAKNDRYATAGKFLEDLNRVLKGEKPLSVRATGQGRSSGRGPTGTVRAPKAAGGFFHRLLSLFGLGKK